MSLIVQVGIAYATAPPDGAPASLVAKLEPAAGAFREAERRFGAFDREIRFYREVAGRVPLRLPRIYYADAARRPTEYGFDDALTDFRLAVLYCLCIPVFSFTMCGPEPEGRTARLVDAIAERLYASAIELDAGALLP